MLITLKVNICPGESILGLTFLS